MAAPGCEEARAGGSALGAGPSPSGPSPSGVARRRGRTLLVRHLPAELTAAEKEELLRHFGAAAVRVLADHGRLVRARGAGGSRGARALRRGLRRCAGCCPVRVGAVTRLCPLSSPVVFFFAALQRCGCVYPAGRAVC